MIRRAQRWQYPAKTQPVQEVALPTLDWLVQYPDPVRRPPELVHEQVGFTRLVELSEQPIDWLVQHPDPLPNPPRDVAVAAAGESSTQQPGAPIPPTSYSSPTSIVFDGGLVQAQARAEPVLVPVAAPVPDIDWLVQHPDPVRRSPELVSEGQVSFTRLVTLGEKPIDWLVQQPDPRRRPPELVSEGYIGFTRLVELSEIPIGWLVQHPDPILPLPRPPTEPILLEFGVPVPPTVPDIDFIVQHPDPLPKPPPTQTGPVLAFEHEDLIPAPDWLRQHPDPVRPPDRVVPGEQFLLEEFLPPLLADIDWLVQHPDPVRPTDRLVPQAFAFEFEHELLIPPIDWLRQLPEPIQELRRPQTEPVVPELSEIPPLAAFDWWTQSPDPVRQEERRQDWYVRGELVEIPIDTWLQPPSQPVRPLPPRQDWYARVDLELIPEVVLLDKWWQPVSQPVYLPVRLQGFLILLEFAVPPGVVVPVVFRFQECQALWEIIHPGSWESAVASSGYIPPPEYIPPPSGYIAVEDGTAPWDMVR